MIQKKKKEGVLHSHSYCSKTMLHYSDSSNEKHVRLAQFSLKDRRFLLEDGTGRGRINDGDNHKAS